MTDPTDAQVGGREPLTMVCEGSGCVAHPLQSVMGIGICAMCGRTVSLNGSVALLHTRDDRWNEETSMADAQVGEGMGEKNWQDLLTCFHHIPFYRACPDCGRTADPVPELEATIDALLSQLREQRDRTSFWETLHDERVESLEAERDTLQERADRAEHALYESALEDELSEDAIRIAEAYGVRLIDELEKFR